jgi:hypothetical protein
MACTMPIVKSLSPEWSSWKNIKSMPCKFKEFSVAKLLMGYPSQFRLDDYDFLLERQLGCVVLYIGPLAHEYYAASANES